MWWYNILGDNNGSISHISQLDPFTTGYFLVDDNIVALKRENYDPILTVKIIEWRKFIDHFGLNFEANPSRVGKKNVDFVHIGYIPSPSSVKLHIERKIWKNSLIFNHEIYVCTNEQKYFC